MRRDTGTTAERRVLVVGATGFVGSRLFRELRREGVKLRLFVRNPSKIPDVDRGPDLEVVAGDLSKNEGLREALRGIGTVYYLVHSMGGKTLLLNSSYAEQDKTAARNFVYAADQEGLDRIIYLGALGDELQEGLSEHLRSRAEVARILSSGKALTTILRAAIIIGAGGASFEMLRYLVERLPVMACPKWIDTRVQPIALPDVLAYLKGCLRNPATAGRSFDIGGPDIFTYREMMQRYAAARGLARRVIFRMPMLTPILSVYWVDLVTPVPSGVAHPLIEGLKNEVVCRENSIEEFVPIRKTPFEEAVRLAVSEERSGPGVTGF